MNYIDTEKDNAIMLGSGYFYALPAKEFVAGTTEEDVSAMDEIGYIKESATFTRTHDSIDVRSANYGIVESFAANYETTFETGIISYSASNVSKYLTGHDIVTNDDGTKTTSYFCENNVVPNVALVFVGSDESTGKSIKIVMPKCKWTGDYQLDFNNDDPVELDYSFKCLNTTLPNGKVGAAYIIEETTSTDES